MPINGMMTGQDAQITLVDALLGQISFDVGTMIDVKQLTKQIKSTALDGSNNYADLPEGWAWDLDFDQANGKLLDYIAANEAAYLSGSIVGNITGTLVLQFVGGGSGSYRFTKGTMKLTNGGMFKGLDKVTQKAAITWSRMIKR